VNLSKEEKRAALSVGRRRYAQITGKRKRGAFLDEFCAVTGLSRKHAIATLNPKRAGPARRRGAPKKHSMRAVRLLVKAWKLAGKPCGKLLRPVLGAYVESLRRHEAVDEMAASEILSMSASTLDRRLRHAKPGAGRGRRREDSLSEHRRKVGLKVDVWPADAKQTPGWVELDTVAHCGGSMSGSFFWTTTLCDVATQWTEMRPAWNKGSAAICGALRGAFETLPVPVLGVNTDNGGEFLNAHLAREFPGLCPGAARSRSRPYVKNDNPHVEQKNGHAVRRILGWGRLERAEVGGVLWELLAAESLFRNLYCATFKLVEKRREAGRWVKRFEKTPLTPLQRVLAHPSVCPSAKARARALADGHDPVALRRRIDALSTRLVRALAAPPAPPSKSPPPSPVRRSDERCKAHSRPGRAGGDLAQ